MNCAFYIKKNGLFVPDRCQMNPGFIGSTVHRPPSGGGGGGGFTYSLIAHTSVSVDGNSTGTTPAINTTGANLFVYSASVFRGTMTIGDSKSNSAPTQLTQHGDTVDALRFNRIAYLISPTVGSGHTFNITSDDIGYCVLCVAAYAKSSGTPAFDSQNGANGAGTNVDHINTGSVTPSADNALVIAAAVWNHDLTAFIDSSFTIRDQANAPSANVISGGLAELIQTSATAANPAWSWGGSSADGFGANIACFK